jgi:catechol 2,3-dioxygenase-like lactoylglutathione lyase family enzyme
MTHPHPTNTPSRFETVTPRLPVTDVEKALAFYVDQLGFQLGWKWGTPVTHGNVCRDSISLDLVLMHDGRRAGTMAYIRLSDVDAYHLELKSRDLAVSEPQDRPYGMRDFEVVDPDGNRLAFGESALR